MFNFFKILRLHAIQKINEYNHFIYSGELSYCFSFWTFIHLKSKEANKYDLLRFSKTLANEKVTSCHRKKSVGFIKYD